jgi:hypothetical protein
MFVSKREKGGSSASASNSRRDKWEKCEIASKVLGGLSIPVVGLVISYILQQEVERNRHAELYANVVAEREKADSDIRAQMFNSLMLHYFGETPGSEPHTIGDFRTKITVLDLLLGNFQEFFNAEPLFEQLHSQLVDKVSGTDPGAARQQWKELDEYLVYIARHTNSRQAALLARVGTSIDEVMVPLARQNDFDEPPSFPEHSRRIALYPTQGLNLKDAFFVPKSLNSKSLKLETDSPGPSNNERYSISIEVHEIEQVLVKVSVFVWKDNYTGMEFKPEESVLLRKIDFDVSYFSSPYMDNTRIVNGSRFAIIYEGCIETRGQEEHVCDAFPATTERHALAQFQVITFKEQFLSQRDRPYVDEILEQAGQSNLR